MPLRPGRRYAWEIVQVIPEFPVVHITFADGTQYTKDMSELMAKGGVFTALRDPEFFAQVSVAHHTVTWPGEVDLCPDSLYMEATGRSGWCR